MQQDRYAVGRAAEGAHQPGSRGRVLANRLGIVGVRAMQQAESDALLVLLAELLDEVGDRQRFRISDLRGWHRRWLGGIYGWAGDFRSVNIGKGGFQFANAQLIPRLMADFERQIMAAHTPCADMGEAQLIRALAVTHAEFILIHPFREGNGRLARLLNSLMAFQAGMPALDYGGIRGKEKSRYIGAIHAAVGGDYEPMEDVFRKVIRRSLRAFDA
jgi:cell filamentation protein